MQTDEKNCLLVIFTSVRVYLEYTGLRTKDETLMTT